MFNEIISIEYGYIHEWAKTRPYYTNLYDSYKTAQKELMEIAGLKFVSVHELPDEDIVCFEIIDYQKYFIAKLKYEWI